MCLQLNQQIPNWFHFHDRSAVPPTSADACLSIVHSLMCYRQAWESEEFTKCAINSLVKKLKEKRDELDSLITAITTNGTHPTRCVTIPRSLDGRLQVQGKKYQPHLMYAKIWRWPDLVKNELKHLRFCQYGFDEKLDSVCVNPYHYERVVSPSIDFVELSLDEQQKDENSKALPLSIEIQHQAGPSTIKHQLPRQSSHSQDSAGMAQVYRGSGNVEDINDGSRSTCLSASSLPPAMYHQTAAFYPTNSLPHDFGPPCPGTSQTFAPPSFSALNASGRTVQKMVAPNTLLPPSPLPLLVASNAAALNEISKSHLQPNEENGGSYSSHSHIPAPSQPANPLPMANWTSSAGLPLHSRSLPSPRSNYHIAEGSNLLPNVNPVQPVSQQPQPDHWCSIAYFEMDMQVGDTFKVPFSLKSVVVDGFFDPSDENRFCLGALSNVHRTERSEKARLHIGKGVRLDVEDEGDVWLTCRSNHPVFLHSFYLDREAGRAPGDAVHKIYPDAYIKVFDLKQCYRQLQQQAMSAEAAAVAQAAAVSGHISVAPNIGRMAAPAIGNGTINVDDLRRQCILRLSFVKGWGPDYPRSTIKSTPCWIEIHLHRALQILDEVLHEIPIDGSRNVGGARY